MYRFFTDRFCYAFFLYFFCQKYRVLAENTNGLKKWNRYSFWTSASDVEFENGTTLESKLGLFSRLETINGLSDGIDADNASSLSASVSLVKKVKNTLIKTFQDMFQLRLGDLRFSRDASGDIWVEWPAQEGTGADSVKKKLGESEYLIKRIILTDRLADAQGNPEWWLPQNEVNEAGKPLYEVIKVSKDSEAETVFFSLGRYQTVYLCVEAITANKYNLHQKLITMVSGGIPQKQSMIQLQVMLPLTMVNPSMPEAVMPAK